jgi:predicted dehydrogenase
MTKLKWGLIGCGDIARKRVAPALRDSSLCELVAVSRARVELAQSFAEEFGARKWYGDWRELVHDKEIDAVYIATPVHLHAEQTTEAARAGKHVLCEKPMAMNVAECDTMLNACRENNVRLGVAYYRHFYPVVHRIKEILSSGEIGRPVIAQMNAFELFDPPESHPRSWLLDPEISGGGPMFDFGCHRLEVLADLFGEVENLQATKANVVFEREVEDVATAVLRFKVGPVATLTVAHSAFEPQDTLDIYCSNGSMHVAVLNAGQLRVVTRDGERVEEHPNHSNIHQPLIEDFARAVLDNTAPIVDGAVGRKVSVLLQVIYRRDTEI